MGNEHCCQHRSERASLANESARLGRKELAGASKSTIDVIFEAVDTNSDGYIDAEEIHLLCEAMSSQGNYVPNNVMKAYKELLHSIDKEPPYGR